MGYIRAQKSLPLIGVGLALALWLAGPARGAGIDCPQADEIKQEVYNCGSDKFATMEAQACSDQVLASWNQAAAALQPLLTTSIGNKQDTSEVNTQANYDQALATLDREIKLMQKYAALVATYSTAMIDFPEGVDDASSAPCFNDAFHDLQDIVTNLDNQIMQAKRVRKLTMGLRNSSDAFHQNLAASLADAIANGSFKAVNGHSAGDPSDVTGLQQARAKAKAAAESGATQKVGRPATPDDSTVTKAPHRASLAPTRLSDVTTGIFEAHGSLDSPQFAAKPASVSGGGSAEESVGASIWQDTASGEKLNVSGLGPAGPTTAKPSLAGDLPGASAAAGPVVGGSLASTGGAATGIEAAESAGLSSLAGPDTDLFAVVHARYRATELFQRAGQK